MKLGIISDCIHYQLPDGSVGTENHILLRQLEALCSYFSETLICCPFGSCSSSSVISTYKSSDIQFLPMPVVGGDGVRDKIKLLKALPLWFSAYKTINAFSDVVYQRFPNNINLPAFFYFYANRKKVFGTYTGTWSSYSSEPVTYRLQRWLLKNVFNGPVWVYANATNSTKISAGFSPSYSIKEWDEESDQVKNRIERLNECGIPVFKMITVGTLIDYKNQAAIVRACVQLKRQNIAFNLTIVGDGPMRNELEDLISQHHLQHEIKLAGKKNYEELKALYRQHDFVVQTPLKEGFGKVPVEGFFHGLVPVITNTSMAGFITANGQRGFLIDAADENFLVDTFHQVQQNKVALIQMITDGRAFAKSQTLEAWAAAYYKTVTEYFA